MTDHLHFDAARVQAALPVAACIAVIREAMVALSNGRTMQLPRSILDLSDRRLFGVMTGTLGPGEVFGAKLIGVFPNPEQPDRTVHEGIVIVFDGETGRPICTADAGAITQIRTAAATAAATDILARADAESLLLMGCGHQAEAHLSALLAIRPLARVMVWGRTASRAETFAARARAVHGIEVAAVTDAEAAAGQADIICTLTSAEQPILRGAWLRPGVHVNLVGSSRAGPAEADDDVVTRSRYFVETRENAKLAAAEFLHARARGLVGDDHIRAEIGEVLAGRASGRTDPLDITVYKSLGHIVQDLAAAAYLVGHDRGSQST